MGGLPINIARLFLVYGKHEASTRLIPTLIKAYRNNESPQLNNPENVRDFVYIDDVIDALIRISDSGHCGEVYNIGSGVEHSVKEVANIVKNIFNSKIDPTWGVAGQRSFEPRHWRADIRKAEKMLSWKPQTDLVSGLEKIINEETQSR
jgi:nucleoside-diphosphate-sugar epimerase